MKSLWFNRLYKDVHALSPHLRMKRIRYGFWRIYYKQAYVHEVYEEMPQTGYDIIDDDLRLELQKHYEEYEEDGEVQRKIKNYVEGYWDSRRRIERRLYMLRNDKEFYENAIRAYQQMVIK